MRNLRILVLLFFHSTVIVNNIYTSKSGKIVQLNKHAFNHKLFHINNLSRNNKGNTDLNLLIQTYRLTDWSFYRASTLWQNHIHRSLSFNFTFSLFLTLEFSREFCYLTWFTIFFFYLYTTWKLLLRELTDSPLKTVITIYLQT